MKEDCIWNPLFSSILNDWEMKEADNLLLYLSGKKVQPPSLEDKVIWLEETKSIVFFFVKSLFKVLELTPLSLSQQVSFGDPRCNLKLAFLLGK